MTSNNSVELKLAALEEVLCSDGIDLSKLDFKIVKMSLDECNDTEEDPITSAPSRGVVSVMVKGVLGTFEVCEEEVQPDWETADSLDTGLREWVESYDVSNLAEYLSLRFADDIEAARQEEIEKVQEEIDFRQDPYTHYGVRRKDF